MVTSQVTDDALAHTAFDGDADAIGLDSAAGHAGLARDVTFSKTFYREISRVFRSESVLEIGGGARATPVVDGVGWSEKRESEVCAPIWLVRLVGVNPGNGRLLMEDKDAAWKLGGEFLGSFVVLNLLKSSRCRSPQLIRLCIFCLQRSPRPINDTSSSKQQPQARGNTSIIFCTRRMCREYLIYEQASIDSPWPSPCITLTQTQPRVDSQDLRRYHGPYIADQHRGYRTLIKVG